MRLLALHGKPEQALTQYERLRSVLSGELAAQPAAATRRLRDEMAAGASADAARWSSAGEGAPRRGEAQPAHPLTSFVGRKQEMLEAKRLFAIESKVTGDLIWDCAPRVDDEPYWAEIGCTLAREHQGRGFASECQ